MATTNHKGSLYCTRSVLLLLLLLWVLHHNNRQWVWGGLMGHHHRWGCHPAAAVAITHPTACTSPV